MTFKRRIMLIVSIVICFLIEAQGADKYTDGNRPYEFGFTIDGEQHRHEKKDEKGLIMGEFGFITADGVYHVTVYATDEQGRFKILSMKNIRVKPYPTYTGKQSSTSARQGHSLELPASSQPVNPPAPTPNLTPSKSISIEPPANACSHCSIPTTSTLAPLVPPSNLPNSNSPNQIQTAEYSKFPQGTKPESASIAQQNNLNIPFPERRFGGESPQVNNAQNPVYPQQNVNVPQPALEQKLVAPLHTNLPPQRPRSELSAPAGNNIPQIPLGPARTSINPPQYPHSPINSQQQPGTFTASPVGPQNSFPSSNIGLNSPNSAPGIQQEEVNSLQYPNDNSQAARGNVPSGRTPKRLEAPSSFGQVGTQSNNIQNKPSISQGTTAVSKKPTLISAQMQIVDKNTDIYRRKPGENEGLPEGLTTDDMTHLLYTFNYTLGFHGHFEEGYTNGVKQGYYFVTGRNGVRTRIDYTADSKGFHPKISQEVLDLLSEDVPKPETEKEEKYGLKGYEFKWLYYPVEAKGR